MQVANEKSKTPMVKVAQAGSDVYDNASSCSAEAELLYLLFEPQTIGGQKRLKPCQRSNMTFFMRRIVTSLSSLLG